MSNVKNILVTGALYMVAGITCIIGMNVGTAIWENGLGEKVGDKARKLFHKKG